jgi:hypothetical protein
MIMAKLGGTRLRSALPILELYRQKLFNDRSFDTAALERELCHAWDMAPQALKPLIIDMARRERYREVAAYYMEKAASPVVAPEFRPSLAALYGADTYRSQDCPMLREAFWKRTFNSSEVDTGFTSCSKS